ncbi:uncharacterized protein [Ptychodera flava]|uniref:uncharacterized protein n=1 Tax=Ptychodera flava TaxID=63121 RepID=UPI00396AAE14
MSREFKYDFFVLYDTNDSESESVAEEFVNEAEKRFQGKKGCSPDRDFPIGGYKHDHIQNAVRDSAVTFVLLPRHSNEQLHFDGLNAVTRLLEENKPENRNRFAPIQLNDEVVLPTYLQSIKCIKWGSQNFWIRVGRTLAHQAEACEEPDATANEAGDAPAGNLDDAILDVVENISPGDCKFLVRRLKLREGDIEDVVHNHQGNAKEMKYQLLMTWQERLGKDASLDCLIGGLKGIRNMQLAHNLERKYTEKEPQQTIAPAKKNQQIPAASVTDHGRVNGQPDPLNAAQVDPIIENPPSAGQVNNTASQSSRRRAPEQNPPPNAEHREHGKASTCEECTKEAKASNKQKCCCCIL